MKKLYRSKKIKMEGRSIRVLGISPSRSPNIMGFQIPHRGGIFNKILLSIPLTAVIKGHGDRRMRESYLSELVTKSRMVYRLIKSMTVMGKDRFPGTPEIELYSRVNSWIDMLLLIPEFQILDQVSTMIHYREEIREGIIVVNFTVMGYLPLTLFHDIINVDNSILRIELDYSCMIRRFSHFSIISLNREVTSHSFILISIPLRDTDGRELANVGRVIEVRHGKDAFEDSSQHSFFFLRDALSKMFRRISVRSSNGLIIYNELSYGAVSIGDYEISSIGGNITQKEAMDLNIIRVSVKDPSVAV